MNSGMVKYLSQNEATNVDVELFNDYKFSVDQLMELAGFACATAVQKTFGGGKALVLCGPGNNGGDGLVCARHLSLFGFQCELVYPKVSRNEIMSNLVHQCSLMDIAIVEFDSCTLCNYNVIVDALFGFSFSPPIRSPFDSIITKLSETQVPIASIDIPSGWHVERGPPSNGPFINPKLLISLTAPKQCAVYLKDSVHYLGGRFVPPRLATKYQLHLPIYPGADCIVKL